MKTKVEYYGIKSRIILLISNGSLIPSCTARNLLNYANTFYAITIKMQFLDPFIKNERQIASLDFALQRDFSNFSFFDETNSDFSDLYLGWSIIIHIANLILGLGFSCVCLHCRKKFIPLRSLEH